MPIDEHPSPAPLTDDERRKAIDDIVSDTAMPVADRQMRLRALAAEWGLRPEPVGDLDPFESQILAGIAMLAEGGHSTGR